MNNPDSNELQENTHKYTILIAEDEAMNFLFLEILLKNQIDLGYTILHAKNGAFASIEDKEKVFAAGFNDFLSKPISKEALVDVINRQIEQKIINKNLNFIN